MEVFPRFDARFEVPDPVRRLGERFETLWRVANAVDVQHVDRLFPSGHSNCGASRLGSLREFVGRHVAL